MNTDTRGAVMRGQEEWIKLHHDPALWICEWMMMMTNHFMQNPDR
jgi:hypothetical protein